jgi:hypothetical protein
MQITDKDTSLLGLLFNEAPLLIRKELATRLGLNEAIVLQQVHFHIQGKYKTVKEKDRADDRSWIEGTFWTYNSYPEWQESDFPFWSASTIERTFKKLEKQGILRSGSFNKMKTDRTKWYTINYEKLSTVLTGEETAENVDVEQSIKMMGSAVEQSVKLTECVVEQSVKMTDSNPSDCREPIRQIDSILPKKSLEVFTKNLEEEDYNKRMQNYRLVRIESMKLSIESVTNFPSSVCEDVATILFDEKEIKTVSLRAVKSAFGKYKKNKKNVGNLVPWFITTYVNAEIEVSVDDSETEQPVATGSVPFYNWLEQ